MGRKPTSPGLNITGAMVPGAPGPRVHKRGCTLAGSKVPEFFKDRKSDIFGVWAAPETFAKSEGRSPPPFWRGLRGYGAPGAAQTPKMTDFRPLKSLEFHLKAQPRMVPGTPGPRVHKGPRYTLVLGTIDPYR